MKWADQDHVAAAAEQWSDQIVSCRTYGHRWVPLSVVKDNAGYSVMQRCSSCGNRRAQDMDFRGYATPWRYVYTEKYLSKGMGRIGQDGKATLRLAAIRNLTVRVAEEATP